MLKFGVAFESLIQMSSIELVAVCISTNNITYTCHDHASYCSICADCVLLYCRCLSPLGRSIPRMSSMTPIKSYNIFRSARQAKPPCSF